MMHETPLSFTVGLSAYAAGDVLGSQGAIELPNLMGRTGALLQEIVLRDLANQKPSIDFLFFTAEPTESTLIDNGAPAFDPADWANYYGQLSIVTDDWKTYAKKVSGNVAGYSANYRGFEAVKSTSSSLWAVPIVQSTPTFVAATDLSGDFKWVMGDRR